MGRVLPFIARRSCSLLHMEGGTAAPCGLGWQGAPEEVVMGEELPEVPGAFPGLPADADGVSFAGL